MATKKGILGQAAPAGSTDTVLYTVGSGRHSTIKVVYANRSATTATVRLAVSPNGAAIEDKHYLAYDFLIAGNDAITSVTFTAGVQQRKRHVYVYRNRARCLMSSQN
jgi:hypothetical protein